MATIVPVYVDTINQPQSGDGSIASQYGSVDHALETEFATPNHLTSPDLATNDEMLLIIVAASSGIKDVVTFDITSAWGTNALENNIRIVPAAGHAVGEVWDENKYIMSFDGSTVNIFRDLWVSGIQVEGSRPASSDILFNLRSGGGGLRRFTDCWLRKLGAGGSSDIAVVWGSDIGAEFGNCIFENWDIGIGNTRSAGNVFLYNCAFINCAAGANFATANLCKANNNLFSGCTNDLTGTFAAGSDYNATDNASFTHTVTGGGNVNDRVGQTFTFSAGFLLAANDTGAYNLGQDLSADANFPIATDARGLPRTTPTDIGPFDADAVVDETGPVYNVSPVVSNISGTDITVTATASDAITATVDHRLVAVAENAAAPNGAQIVAGTDASDNAALAVASQLGVTNGVQAALNFTLPNVATPYDLYLAVVDENGNITTAAKLDVTTGAGPRTVALSANSGAPGASITVTLTNFTGTPTATLNGVSLTLSGASSAGFDFNVPAVGEFVAAGSHANTRWGVAQSLVVTDSGGSASTSFTVDPVDTDGPDNWFGQLAGVSPSAATHFPNAEVGDDYRATRLSGTGVNVNNFLGSEADSNTWSLQIAFFDVSLGAWSAAVVDSYDVSGADTTNPTVVSAAINAAGDTLTINTDENVIAGAHNFNDFALTLSGGAVIATYTGGSGTQALTYSLNRTVLQGESGTLAYTQQGDGVKDAVGNVMATFSGLVVANGSTETINGLALSALGAWHVDNDAGALIANANDVMLSVIDQAGNDIYFASDHTTNGAGEMANVVLAGQSPGDNLWLSARVISSGLGFPPIPVTVAVL